MSTNLFLITVRTLTVTATSQNGGRSSTKEIADGINLSHLVQVLSLLHCFNLTATVSSNCKCDSDVRQQTVRLQTLKNCLTCKLDSRSVEDSHSQLTVTPYG
jgi:hypothetical protein